MALKKERQSDNNKCWPECKETGTQGTAGRNMKWCRSPKKKCGGCSKTKKTLNVELP